MFRASFITTLIAIGLAFLGWLFTAPLLFTIAKIAVAVTVVFFIIAIIIVLIG